MTETLDILSRLTQTIAARRDLDPKTSYVAQLLASGTEKQAQKLGEEAIETVIAALSGDRKQVTNEAADLVFHLLVLLEGQGLSINDILAELERREGISGHDEKAGRSSQA